MDIPDPSTLTEAELRRALKRLMVNTSLCRTREDLEAKYKQYATPSPVVAAVPSKKNAAAGTYVNGQYIAPPRGLADTIGGWKVVLVVALASGFLFTSQQGSYGPEADSLNVRANEWAFGADDIDAGLSGHVIEIRNHQHFLGALAYHWDVTNLPVVIDFYGAHCGPCKAIAPVYNQLAETYKGKMVFLKVDTAKNQPTSTMMGVRGLPTFMFYSHGQVHAEYQFSGANQGKLIETVELLAKKAKSEGVYINKHFSKRRIESFLESVEENKPEDPPAEAAKLIEEYKNRPAKLARYLRLTYNSVPKATRSKTPIVLGESRSWFDTVVALLGFGESEESSTNDEVDGDEDDETNEDEVTQDATSLNIAGVKYMSPQNYLGTRTSPTEQTVIIGAGPAGLSAAIYAARAGLNPVVVTPVHGGQLLGKGVGVENFPGIMTGGEPASGELVVNVMRRQAASFGTKFLNAEVETIQTQFNESSNFGVKLRSHKPSDDVVFVLSKSIIVATGSYSRWLGVPGEEKFKGRGVTSCATCDGHLFREKPVMVIGGGDSAMEDALVLARTSESVILVHRGTSFRASKVLASRVLNNEKITVKWSTVVESFEGEESGLKTVNVLDTSTGDKSKITVDAAFIAIGHIPNSQILGNDVKKSDSGYVWVEPRSTQTSIPGLFACGDIADDIYRQAVTSAGTGAMAALDAERWLSKEN